MNKKHYLLFTAIFIIALAGLFNTIIMQPKQMNSPEQNILLDDIKPMLSNENIDVSHIELNISKEKLRIYLPFSFSPVLFNQISAVENYSFQINIPEDLKPYTKENISTVTIPQKDLIYRSNHQLALQAVLPLNPNVKQECLAKVINYKQPAFKLLFLDPANQIVVTFSNIKPALADQIS